MEHHESLFGDPRTWVGIAFILFFVIFGRRIWTSLTAALDKRGIAIQTELNEASRLRTEAEAMLKDAQAQRQAALGEAEQTIARARDEAARMADAARTDAATAATRRERMAMDRIGAAEKAAVTDVRLAAADIAARAAEQVIRQGFGAEADASLIDHAIQGLPAALAGRRAA